MMLSKIAPSFLKVIDTPRLNGGLKLDQVRPERLQTNIRNLEYSAHARTRSSSVCTFRARCETDTLSTSPASLVCHPLPWCKDTTSPPRLRFFLFDSRTAATDIKPVQTQSAGNCETRHFLQHLEAALEQLCTVSKNITRGSQFRLTLTQWPHQTPVLLPPAHPIRHLISHRESALLRTILPASHQAPKGLPSVPEASSQCAVLGRRPVSMD